MLCFPLALPVVMPQYLVGCWLCEACDAIFSSIERRRLMLTTRMPYHNFFTLSLYREPMLFAGSIPICLKN